jgi:hypothetical protein
LGELVEELMMDEKKLRFLKRNYLGNVYSNGSAIVEIDYGVFWRGNESIHGFRLRVNFQPKINISMLERDVNIIKNYYNCEVVIYSHLDSDISPRIFWFAD